MNLSNDCKILSLDIETLSLANNALVLSVGFCLITVKHGFLTIGDRQYFTLPMKEQQNIGRSVDKATELWWSKQEGEARVVLDASKFNTLRLHEVVTGIAQAMKALEADYVLAKDPDFDCTILESLFTESFITPIEFSFLYNKRLALRTLQYAYELKTGAAYSNIPPLVKHNAIEDAAAQAMDYCVLHSVIAGSLGHEKKVLENGDIRYES